MKFSTLLLAIAGLACVASVLALALPFFDLAGPAFFVAGAAFFTLIFRHDYADRRTPAPAGRERLPYAA